MSGPSANDWVATVTADEMAEAEPYRVVVDGTALVMVRLGDEVLALEDRCSHQKVALSGGFVDADTRVIECPKHGSEFSLDTGDVLSLPANKPVARFETRSRDDGIVEVLFPVGQPAE